jgi:hypothetical protein
MKNINTCISTEFKLPQKACNKCYCDCHEMNGINGCEDITEAFQLGYENWYEPCNPYVIGSNDYSERQRARKLAKKNPGFIINVKTKKNHLVYSAKLDSEMILTHPSIVLDCIIYIRNKSIVTNVIFVNYYFPPDWKIHDKIISNWIK